MNFKRYVEASDTWVDSHYIKGTDTDTITTLPATIYPLGQSATIGLKGNTVQSSTPTPDNPVDVVGCGDNLTITASDALNGLDSRNDTLNLANGIISRIISKVVLTGEEGWTLQSINQYDIANFWVTVADETDANINTQAAKRLSSHFVSQTSLISVTQTEGIFINTSKQLYIRISKNTASTVQELQNWLRGQYNNDTPVTVWYVKNATSTESVDVPAGLSGTVIGYTTQSATPTTQAPDYPDTNGSKIGNTYSIATGLFKIPISSANTTTNVYLGEVQSTRKIKKLVLTGQEDFTKNDGESTHYLYHSNRGTILRGSIDKSPVLCNELPVKDRAPQTEIGINTNNSFSVVYFNFGADVMNAQPSGNTARGLKEYLAAQYAAGTPVTIWYVLDIPETAVVNEPIRKIGDYADEISDITIPTIAGANTLSVDTTLQPNEVSVNYHGWHEGTVHERDSEAWD